MSQFNVQQMHPLIPREQTFVLDRKLVSVHSYDRDIKKWPNSNHFEVDLFDLKHFFSKNKFSSEKNCFLLTI